MSDLKPYTTPPSDSSSALVNSDNQTDFGMLGRRFALAGLLIPPGLFLLAMVGLVRPRWDSSALPLMSLFSGVFCACLAIVFSLAARRRQRTSSMIWTLILAVLALPLCLFVTWYLAMMGLGHASYLSTKRL